MKGLRMRFLVWGALACCHAKAASSPSRLACFSAAVSPALLPPHAKPCRYDYGCVCTTPRGLPRTCNMRWVLGYRLLATPGVAHAVVFLHMPGPLLLPAGAALVTTLAAIMSSRAACHFLLHHPTPCHDPTRAECTASWSRLPTTLAPSASRRWPSSTVAATAWPTQRWVLE